jgi:hypothetical protein
MDLQVDDMSMHSIEDSETRESIVSARLSLFVRGAWELIDKKKASRKAKRFPLQVHLGRFLLVRTNDTGTMAFWCRHKQVVPYGQVEASLGSYRVQIGWQYTVSLLWFAFVPPLPLAAVLFEQETLAYMGQPKVGARKANCPVMWIVVWGLTAQFCPLSIASFAIGPGCPDLRTSIDLAHLVYGYIIWCEEWIQFRLVSATSLCISLPSFICIRISSSFESTLC